jgi:hypothetical protein
LDFHASAIFYFAIVRRGAGPSERRSRKALKQMPIFGVRVAEVTGAGSFSSARELLEEWV